MVNQIRDKASGIADGKTSEVFALAFTLYKRRKLAGYKENYHENKTDTQLINGGCSCEYCTNLRKYVVLKKAHHREKRILFDDNEILSYREVVNLQKYLNELEEKFKKHKRRKDQIKNDLKI